MALDVLLLINIHVNYFSSIQFIETLILEAVPVLAAAATVNVSSGSSSMKNLDKSSVFSPLLATWNEETILPPEIPVEALSISAIEFTLSTNWKLQTPVRVPLMIISTVEDFVCSFSTDISITAILPRLNFSPSVILFLIVIKGVKVPPTEATVLVSAYD